MGASLSIYSRTNLIAEKFLQIAVRESGCLAVNFVKQYKYLAWGSENRDQR